MTTLIKNGTVITSTGVDTAEILIGGETIAAGLQPGSEVAATAEAGADQVIDCFCILGDEDAHIERLQELEALGVDQFAICLMHDQDETLTAYGQRVIPTITGVR